MPQQKLAESTVSSPCINICELNPENVCIGCYRSIDEIAGWRDLSQTEKKLIIEESRKRKALLNNIG